jgi:hypothetical protein
MHPICEIRVQKVFMKLVRDLMTVGVPIFKITTLVA